MKQKRLRFLFLVSIVAGMLTSGSVAFAKDSKPLALILLDTSNTMEFEAGPSRTFPACYYNGKTSALGKISKDLKKKVTAGQGSRKNWCAKGKPNEIHGKSRFIIAQEVLTGRFIDSEYYCCQTELSAQEEPSTIPYHFMVPSSALAKGRQTGVGQVQDGIMDTYKDDVHFALMTYDTNPESNKGVSGNWSYGDNVNSGKRTWNTGGKNSHANRGFHGSKLLKHKGGALKAWAGSKDNFSEQNDELQEEIRWLFPQGDISPLASMIDDGRTYIQNSEVFQQDKCIDQRPRGVILITDGEAHFDECFVEDGSTHGYPASPISYNTGLGDRKKSTCDGGGDDGLIGGHIDVDTSSFLAPVNAGWSATDGHAHQYDDKYNVSGPDFFNLKSSRLHNITKDIKSPSQPFRLILGNADLSPGGRLVINKIYDPDDNTTWVNVFNYDDIPIDDLPIYSLNGAPGTIKLEQLSIHFALNAIGGGGLHPLDTWCLRRNIPGREGEWRNGSLTLQAVKVDSKGNNQFSTKQSYSNGGVQGLATSGLLWEAAMFWHWPSDICYHEPEWNHVIGKFDEDEVGECVDETPGDDCNAFNYNGKEYQYPWWKYETSERMAAKLNKETGFPIYVIGFDASPEADSRLRGIAFEGKTCDDINGDDCYYTASGEKQLQFAMEDIISRMTSQSADPKSRSGPVSTNRTSFRDVNGGYYEVTTDFHKVGNRNKGRVERVTYECNNTSGEYEQKLVEDLGENLGAMPFEQRTIYTSLSPTLHTTGTLPGSVPPSLSLACPSIEGCDDEILALIIGDENNAPFLGDSYHAQPIVSVGPQLDLPLRGYQKFRKEHGDRDTVLYVATNAGVLHSFLLGDIEHDSNLNEGDEMWAYVPRIIHDRLPEIGTGHKLTLDGTPVIKDLRLYRNVDLEPIEEWGTILVGGLRGGGRGAYALDVTDPEKPKFLWEISNKDNGFSRLGNTYGKPLLGAVLLEGDSEDAVKEQSIVIIPGGISSGIDENEGKSLFVVNAMTGELIREFTSLKNDVAMAEISGSISTNQNLPGTLINRAFVGDAEGRLLRLLMDSKDPADWTLEVFHDPMIQQVASGDGRTSEHIVLEPAIAEDRNGNLVIVYGSGDLSSFSPDGSNANFVVSITEKISIVDGETVSEAEENWRLVPKSGFKMTGPPVIFDSVAYVPTLVAAPWENCFDSVARLQAIHFTDTNSDGSLQSVVDLDGDGEKDLYTDFAPGTIIFGLDVTIRPTCFKSGSSDSSIYGALQNSQHSTPQLILQTSNKAYKSGENPTGGTSSTPVTNSEKVDKVRIDIPRPIKRLFPLSWGIIYR